MIRRALWLGTGVALGAGGTLWARRQVGALSRRLQPARVAGGVVTGVEHRVRSGTGRVRHAVEAGRVDARRRETELRRQLRPVGRDG